MKIENALLEPKVYYGLHMVPGIAGGYPIDKTDPKKGTYNVLCSPEFCRSLDATYPGKPVVVLHDMNITPENREEKADGYVVESFFNKSDGMHWAKFLVITQEGVDAIEKKHWKLSNSYVPGMDMGGAGKHQGVQYLKEYRSGRYDHLAIVPNPRYDQSIILTPDQFKQYNLQKEQELLKVANSKEKDKKPMRLNLFKREKVENSTEVDFDKMMVELPKSKKEMTLEQVVNDLDSMYMNRMANMDHMVKMNDSEMTVNELVQKYNAMCAAKNQDEEEKKKALEKTENMSEEEKKANAEKEKEEAEKKANAEKEAAEKKANEDKAATDKKANAAVFEKVANAAAEAAAKAPRSSVMTDSSRVKLGQKKYGSAKK